MNLCNGKTLFLFVLMFYLSGNALLAQDKIASYIFKGTLRSAVTNEIIPYGHVIIKGEGLGVAANDEGQFEFPIQNKFFSDSIQISALGFKKYEAAIKNLRDKAEHSILLKDTAYVLTEVLVSAMSAEEIVHKALDTYEDNFPNSPYEMDVFYRTTLKENDDYVELLECTFKAYDRGFNVKEIANAVDISYQGVRKSNVYTNSKTNLPAPFFKPQWLMTVENYARNKQMLLDNMKQSVYEFELDTPTYFNDKLVYIVNANVKEAIQRFIFSAKFYIRADDYAIVQLDFDGKDKVSLIQPSGIPASLKLKILEYKATYVFKSFNDRMYMHYLNNYVIYNWLDSKSGKLINNNEENSQAIIQNINFPPNGKSTLHRPANRKLAAIPLIPYDSAYWLNNDMVKQIPYDPKISSDLEKKGVDLEKQFTANSRK